MLEYICTFKLTLPATPRIFRYFPNISISIKLKDEPYLDFFKSINEIGTHILELYTYSIYSIIITVTYTL